MQPVPLTEDGPDGNLGGLTCFVCHRPGWLIDMTDKGFHIAHAGTPFLCRAPLEPPANPDVPPVSPDVNG